MLYYYQRILLMEYLILCVVSPSIDMHIADIHMVYTYLNLNLFILEALLYMKSVAVRM